MSDALTYLVQARPEALGHYLKFLKAAGQGLDPKTRDLISVITKVHARTERGLRQYLRRALRDGCTADEILDALLVAFPALGLTKILWAIDVILAMDLPEFRHVAAASVPAGAGSPTPAERWHDLLEADAVAVGQTVCVAAGGRTALVHRSAAGFRVHDSRCPHQGTDLASVVVQGDRLVCPKHGWAFDPATGACVAEGSAPLRERPARVEDGRLLAWW